MFNNTKLVLESGKSEKEKIEALEEIFGNYIWARLYKNNSIYFKTSFTRPKQVYTDKGLNATMDSIKESIGSKIHDFKNQWSNWEYPDEKEVDLDKERNIVDTILKDLESLNTVFDVNYSDFRISEVEKIIKSSLSRQYREAPESEFKYQCLIKDEKIENMFVSINKHRLKSIIINLLQNADKAILRHKFSLSKKEREKYKRYMALTIYTEIYEGKQYFTICLEDNGGGFAKPDKIYYEPIESSDLSRGKRMGSGTIYVGMFVHRMNGIIKAYNKIMSDGNIGACTKILLPLKEAKKDV